MDKIKNSMAGSITVSADNVELVVHNPPVEDLGTSGTEKKNG